MGAELIYEARNVLLLANGERRRACGRITAGDPTPDVPISYGQVYAKNGGNLTYVLDKVAAKSLIANTGALKKKGVTIEIL